jgi:hypothetical protein
MNRLFGLLLVAAVPLRLHCQQASPAPQSALNAYLDCQNTFCDFDYFRTEIGVVNWVRDRAVADLHLLVTSQQTGSGGREYTVSFIGLRQFVGINDTLKYVAPPASTDDEQRKGLAGLFRLGLVRYFARLPEGAKITVSFPSTAAGSGQTTTKKDPWKAWVFRFAVEGFTYGEETYNEVNRHGRFDADRVTEGWKTRISFRENRYRSEQTYPTCDASNVCRDTTVIVKRESYERNVTQVKSLTAHLSAGVRGSMFASLYDNHRRVFHVFPAIEYNVFPYSQSTRRQLRAEYNVGYGHYEYNDVTLNDKLSEAMPIQRLLLGVAVREPWGSVDLSGRAVGYLNNRDEYRLSVFGSSNVRLFKGFELSWWGEYNYIRDQFSLPKKNFTPQEILTRQFQLGTRYRYYGSVGISYTFGSIFNNVVNPRMN